MIQIQLYNQDKTTCCVDVSLATKRKCGALSHCFILATWLEKLFGRPILATLALRLLRSSSSHKSLNSFARVLFFSAIQGKTWKLSPWLMVFHSMVGINEDQDFRGEFGFSNMSTPESICTISFRKTILNQKSMGCGRVRDERAKTKHTNQKELLLMEEILYHLGCIKSYGYWDIYYINWCRISEPSTVWHNRHHPVLCSVSWGATSWPVPQEKPLEATKEIPGESNIILHQDEVVSL